MESPSKLIFCPYEILVFQSKYLYELIRATRVSSIRMDKGYSLTFGFRISCYKLPKINTTLSYNQQQSNFQKLRNTCSLFPPATSNLHTPSTKQSSQNLYSIEKFIFFGNKCGTKRIKLHYLALKTSGLKKKAQIWLSCSK